MTKQELVELLDNFPENTEIMLCDGLETYEISYSSYYPAVGDFAPVLPLDMGERRDLEFDLDNRDHTTVV